MWSRFATAARFSVPAIAATCATAFAVPSFLPIPACDAAEAAKKPVGKGNPPKHHVPNPRMWVHDAINGEGKLFKRAVGISAEEGLERLSNMAIFSGSSNPSLAEEIAYELHKPLGKVTLGRFADGEITVQVNENVRGKDVFIIQSTSQPVHENLMELLLMISTMRRASARTITAVIPYYGYKRDVGTAPSFLNQLRGETRVDVMDADTRRGVLAELRNAPVPVKHSLSAAVSPKESTELEAEQGGDSSFPVSAADVAKMLEAMGVDRVVSVDLQPPGHGQIEGFFSSTVPVENVRAAAIAVEHFRKLPLKNVVIVSPNEACIRLAQDFRSGLEKTTGKPVGFATIIEAGPSRGADRYVHKLKSKSEEPPRLELVGDVSGSDVVIVDDMIDTGYTLVRRLQHLKDAGAERILAFATHGLFNGSALSRITKSPLSQMIVTNTVPLRDDVDMRHTHKIAQLSIAPVLAEAVLRIQTGKSLQNLRVFDRDNAEARYKGQE